MHGPGEPARLGVRRIGVHAPGPAEKRSGFAGVPLSPLGGDVAPGALGLSALGGEQAPGEVARAAKKPSSRALEDIAAGGDGALGDRGGPLGELVPQE